MRLLPKLVLYHELLKTGASLELALDTQENKYGFLVRGRFDFENAKRCLDLDCGGRAQRRHRFGEAM